MIMEESTLVEYVCVKCWAVHYYSFDCNPGDDRCVVGYNCQGGLILLADLTQEQRKAKKEAEEKRDEN